MVAQMVKNLPVMQETLVEKIPWKRKWQPTPVFLPGESQGQGSLVGCHLWGRAESDTTEVTPAWSGRGSRPSRRTSG